MNRQHQFKYFQSGFSLVELMVVVVIIGVLASVGIPSYTDYVAKAKRNAAQQMLMHIATQQEQYFMDNKTYASQLNLLGYDDWLFATDKDGDMVPFGDVSAQYVFAGWPETITASGTVTAYYIRAYAWGTQRPRDMECYIMELDSAGDQSSYGTLGDDCW